MMPIIVKNLQHLNTRGYSQPLQHRNTAGSLVLERLLTCVGCKHYKFGNSAIQTSSWLQ